MYRVISSINYVVFTSQQVTLSVLIHESNGKLNHDLIELF